MLASPPNMGARACELEKASCVHGSAANRRDKTIVPCYRVRCLTVAGIPRPKCGCVCVPSVLFCCSDGAMTPPESLVWWPHASTPTHVPLWPPLSAYSQNDNVSSKASGFILLLDRSNECSLHFIKGRPGAFACTRRYLASHA